MRALSKRFKRGNYLDCYTKSTDIKASIDSKMAIGGLWEEMGRHQFEFLKAHGLMPNHRFLDIGCGSLRGGLFFIDYLEDGNYTGFDLSSEVLSVGSQKVIDLGMQAKNPRLLLNSEKSLTFGFLNGSKFDCILAQSVFSHLKPNHIEECFENLSKVMTEEARFFFTHHPGHEYRERSHTDFEYPKSYFEQLSDECGFTLVDLSAEYEHPRGQNMLMAKRR